MKKFLSARKLVVSQKHTLLNNKKLFILLFFTLLQRMMRKTIVEIGVYRGGTSLLMSIVYGKNYRKMQYLIDPLSGHPFFSLSKFDSVIHSAGHFSDTSFDHLTKLYASIKHQLPILIPKAVEEVLEFQDPSFIERVGLVHLDTDLYLPTLFALNKLGSHMRIGSVIIVDDFQARKCPGIELAINDFMAKHGHNFSRFSWTKEQLILIRIHN